MEDHHTRYAGPTALLRRAEASLFCGTAELLSWVVGQFWHISPGNHSLGAATDEHWVAGVFCLLFLCISFQHRLTLTLNTRPAI